MGRESEPRQQNRNLQKHPGVTMEVNKHLLRLGEIAFALKNITADVETIRQDLKNQGIAIPSPSSRPRVSPTPSVAATQDSMLAKVNAAYKQYLWLEHLQLQNDPLPLPPANVTEVEGDLFLDAPEEAALAHCIGEDALCTRGHAATPKDTLLKGLLPYLRSLGKKTGEVATLLVGEKYIFNLVTKPLTKGRRPYLHDFRSSVTELARLCTTLGIKKLAMPRIGAGLDRIPWREAKKVIIEAFAGCPTEVQIFKRPDETRRDYAAVVKSGLPAPATPVEMDVTPETTTAPEPMPEAEGPTATSTPAAPTEGKRKVSPSERLTNDLEKRASRDGSPNRKESDARARSGDRLVPIKKSTDQSKPKTLFPAELSEAVDDELGSELSPDAAASPVPGRGDALKVANATVTAEKGGAAGRSTETCGLTGVLPPSALSSTPPYSSGELDLEFLTPATSPVASETNSASEEIGVFSLENNMSAIAADATTVPLELLLSDALDDTLSQSIEVLQPPPKRHPAPEAVRKATYSEKPPFDPSKFPTGIAPTQSSSKNSQHSPKKPII